MDSNRIEAARLAAAYVPRPVQRSEQDGEEREFNLDDGDEPAVVIEPQPRRTREQSLPVSAERLPDEAGQNLDVRG